MIDLHIHTTASDGSMTPAEVVHLARSQGLQAIAITDHDTIAGNSQALETGRRLDFEVIPGVEISADAPFGSLHIVGLFIDPEDDSLESVLKDLRDYREQRNRKMIRRLEELGLPLTVEELAREAGGDLIGRPHFAALMVKKGYVKDYREAFDKYLKAGGKAYLDKKRLPADKAIALIRRAGGTAILAHPFTLRQKDADHFEENLRYLIDRGMQGIEVYYSEHSKGDEALFSDIARRYNLLISGGSDFHGEAKPDIQLGRGFGSMRIPYEVLEGLKEARL